MRLQTPDEPGFKPVRNQNRWGVIAPFIPEGGVGAELGVYKGGFVDYLLQSKPSKLWLVDLWYKLGPVWSWGAGDTSTTNALAKIITALAPELAAGTVDIRVERSETFLASLPDGSLDWVYIDTSHDMQQVLVELTLAWAKVKPGGVIMGDDFDADLASPRPGVRKAVNRFASKKKLELMVAGASAQFVMPRA